MKFVGFNFTKINVEKTSDIFKDLKINTNIDVSNIEQLKNEIFKAKEELLGVKFKYGVDYGKVGKIELEGNVLVSIESKEAKSIMKEWKNKKIPEDFKISVFNVILRKSTLKALQLEDEMNLPIHTRTIPRVGK